MTWQTLPAAIRHAAQSLLLRPLYYPATLPVARLWDEMDQRLHALFDQPGQTVETLKDAYRRQSGELRMRWSQEDPSDGTTSICG